jgi:UDP-N-acetylmuramoyl-L-alanyl-D-glutamate--2,6-diaminopimelate ligase
MRSPDDKRGTRVPGSFSERRRSGLLQTRPTDMSSTTSTTTIGELIDGLPIALLAGAAGAGIGGVADDSRQVQPGHLFIARRGSVQDGRRFIDDAVARGAAAVLCDVQTTVPAGTARLVPCDSAPGPAALGAHLAERFHGEPSRSLKLIGITGTNGKTTTAHLIRHLLNQAGVPCGFIGTVHVDAGAGPEPAELTTPSAPALSSLLRRMVDAGLQACAMEVSSHALDQDRVAGLRFRGAVFTNLSGDHLDYHRSMEAYLEAKCRLLDSVPPDGWLVLNADDPVSPKLAGRCHGTVIRCRLGRPADCSATIGESDLTGTSVAMTGPWGRFGVQLPLIGAHNVVNALQAAATGNRLGLGGAMLEQGLSRSTAPPGRLERVTEPGNPCTVLVDYAHTDDALRNVLSQLRPLVPAGGSLRVVFGCGGDRDRTKRPRMAAAAWSFADEVIVTSDNPRTEPPEAIIEDVWRGVPEHRRQQTIREVDRREAIRAGVSRCRPGDLLLIAGKGHEEYQIMGTQRLPFDDREVARAALDTMTVQAGSTRASIPRRTCAR